MKQKKTLSIEQDMAANPSENIWVQANAGTGKTTVLVQRLLRILFRGGTDDNNGILCLTYTNAGAGEMRNRILTALREWVMSSDDELTELLRGVSYNKTPTDDDLIRARQIFFKYIDNPEILKIKTIHGFCEEILHRFPLEAGVSPAWSLVSDAAQRVLLQDAFDKLINSSNDAVVMDAFMHIVGRISEHSINDLLGLLGDQYKDFFQVKDIVKYREYFIETTKEFLELNNNIRDKVSQSELEKIIENTKQDIIETGKSPKYLTDIVDLTQQYIDKRINFEEYKKAYLTDKDGKIVNVSKKGYLVHEQERVYAVNQRNINTTIFEDTLALFDLSAAFAKIYRELKVARNLLDFEDLILYTRELFSNPETMGWVLSQLNIRLGHILVDEAQDTAPLQWDILRMLSGDFFADGDTSETPHSLFVVGDTKQSIYGFQGADPDAFASSREEIAKNIEQNMRTIQEIPLAQSFRSLPAILTAVDSFFGDSRVFERTGFINNNHLKSRTGGTGIVELHKLQSKSADEITQQDYVRTIVDKIVSLIETGVCRASDIMILVQQRRPFVALLTAELKRRNLDVAGSDRVVLPDFAVLRDLMNLVRFCLDTSDDYSLCCVLKSPIFGLTERDIYNICLKKNTENNTKKNTDASFVPTTVYDVLQKMYPDIFATLTDVVERSKVLSPYSFFDSVLNSVGIRESFIAALGNQILDPLEEFMTICLSYERTQCGTLKHFLKWFITGGSEVKRDMDSVSGIRIATVHGSKGLEAPVVFLVDTTRIPEMGKVIPLSGKKTDMPVWLWTPRGGASLRRDDAVAAVMRNQIAEYYRLLYVAMTRAQDKLYIYGFTSNKNASDISWHSQLWNILGPESDNGTIRITDDE